jgi:nucleotidyltransferase substrate binding protein (TIGR01987 family)
MNDRRRTFLASWEQALGRFSEVLLRDSSDRIVIDAAIQRFEFCFELGWKTLKVFLEFEGYTPATPRQTLKDALKIQWLKDEQAWLQMLQDRNLTAHTYHEALANQIYSRLSDHHARMSEVFGFLNQYS